MSLPELCWLHRELVQEIHAHNCEVIVRRRAGGDWDAPENRYRNALAEIEALRAQQDRAA